MNIYIDFDHTLYNPIMLTSEMLSTICDNIVDTSNKNIDKEELNMELNKMFNRENIYNIFELARFWGKKYEVDSNLLIDAVNKVLYNCSKYVFEDVIPFLSLLKEKGYKIFMLSYYEYGLEYQMAKITGSKLCDLFNGIIVTGEKKHNLTIDYENSVFIDDKPEDIEGLILKKPYRLIRIRRKEGRYSSKLLNVDNIEEVETLAEIKI